MSRRPRLLVFNQYYWPGVEATARLLTQLCEELATEFDVTVVTGRLYDTAARHERVVRNGVKIIRVPSTAFDRSSMTGRVLNYTTFLGSSLWMGLNGLHPDVVLCMTDPPMLGSVALPVARRYGAPLVMVTQDVFPEIAIQLGRLEQPLVVEALRRVINYSLGRADSIVAIGETMRLRLEMKGVNHDRITVIPNWADTAEIAPVPRRNEWASEHGLERSFVVMHSGNVGYAQDLETLVRASTLLRDLDDLMVVVIGSGARLNVLRELAERIDAEHVMFLPYQAPEVLSRSLSSADVHFVGLAHGLAGYVVPSRLYGIMAAGRPVLASAEAESETARLVESVGCGIVVPPGRVDLVARVIRELRSGQHDLEEMGRRGFEFVRREANRDVAADRYRTLLGGLARKSRQVADLVPPAP